MFSRGAAWWSAAGALAVCLILRIAVLILFQEDLGDDRDAYLGLARNLWLGIGYTTPGGVSATAFRPPLYPLVIAPFAEPGREWGIALLHLSFSLGTCLLILRIGKALGLSNFWRSLAALLFALDPVSVRYVAFPMTETLCTFLVALFLSRLTRPSRSIGSSFLTGLVWGACVLCRPSLWAFGGLFALTQLVRAFRDPRQESVPRRPVRIAVATGGVLCWILPWALRNWMVLGAPIVMTTHGGYTLLLGNNQSFYREVVAQPWGTVWDGSRGEGQSGWVEGINREMEQAGLFSEVERDAWMAARARETIVSHPWRFARACLLRVRRFWNLVPLAPVRAGMSGWAVTGIGSFYALLWGLMVIGTVRIALDRTSLQDWLPVLTLILALTCVHAIYWSNSRMRAPVVPAIVLVASRAGVRVHRSGTIGTN